MSSTLPLKAPRHEKTPLFTGFLKRARRIELPTPAWESHHGVRNYCPAFTISLKVCEWINHGYGPGCNLPPRIGCNLGAIYFHVQSQGTYHGKTGGGLVATATVEQSKAGTWEVWIDGEIAELSDYDELILTDMSGVVAAVALSPTALRRMRELIAQCEQAYKEGVSSAARALGSRTSAAKKASSRENGKKGGRPKKII